MKIHRRILTFHLHFYYSKSWMSYFVSFLLAHGQQEGEHNLRNSTKKIIIYK